LVGSPSRSDIAAAGPTRPEPPRQSSFADATDLPKVCPQCGTRYPVEFNVCPRDATQLDDVALDDDDLTGTTLAQTYTLVRLVGEGGMGRVYEAKHTRIPSRRFAIKLLHPEYARHGEVLSRFQREAEAAASIESAHVADVYDVHKTSDGRPFIVAEFLEGRELAEFLKERGKLEVGFSVRVVRQVCEALIAAHDKGIVHRDMKPENVFLTGDLTAPVAKVIDFGISKFADSGGSNLTKTGMIMGTPAYMAPEQARGEKVDLRADVYAVGAILYNMLTGKRPFDRSDPTATITAVLLEEPERPCALNPAIPQALELVIQRAMAKNAKDRYPSLRELSADLAEYDPDESAAASLVAPGSGPLSTAASTQLAPKLRGSRAMMVREAREVELSRPIITLMGGLAGVGVLGALLTFIGAIIRLSRGGGPTANVTGSESLILISMLALALATPAVFAILHVKKAIWNNTAKTVELASSLRRSVTTAFVAYGLGSIGVHFVETLILRRAAGAAWPVWDLLLTIVAAGAAALGWMWARAERAAR
jgi:serine/threonine-protein kinase